MFATCHVDMCRDPRTAYPWQPTLACDCR